MNITSDLLNLADFIEHIDERECHPALYKRRQASADKLRRLSADPSCLEHKAYYNTIVFLCYVRPK